MVANILVVTTMLYDFDTGAFKWQQSFSDNYSDNYFVVLTLIFIAIIYLIALIASLLLFIFWTYRAACNVRGLGATDVPTSPTWAVLWYFIPIAFFWKPYVALRDIWAASEDPEGWVWVEVPLMFNLYWILCVISNLISIWVFRAEDQIAELPLGSAVMLELAMMTLALIYSVLQIRIIENVTAAQKRNWEQTVFA